MWMADGFMSSDVTVLDLLRQQDGMTVTQMATELGVTSTAVRHRLQRLMEQEYIDRSVVRYGRGRPRHHYCLTSKGRRKTGSNFQDLALALWQEIARLEDPEIRRGAMERLASRLARMYADRIQGQTLEEKMQALSELFAERQIPMNVQQEASFPVLQTSSCPYPDLARKDRSICSVEQMLFSQLLGEKIHLSQCRLDGASCCSFASA